MVACAALLAALLGGVGTAKVDSTSWAALSKPATICGDADHSESCWDLLGDGQVEVESGGCARGCCTGCSSGVLLSLGMSKHTRGETKCATHISSEPRTKPAAGASAHSRARAPRRNHLLLSRGISATIYYALARTPCTCCEGDRVISGRAAARWWPSAPTLELAPSWAPCVA